MKKVIFILLLSSLVGLLGCGPTKDEMEAKAKEVILTANKKYKVADIVYLKPDSCKGLIIGYQTKYAFTEAESPEDIYYLIRDCRGQETTITTDNFIYGKEK